MIINATLLEKIPVSLTNKINSFNFLSRIIGFKGAIEYRIKHKLLYLLSRLGIDVASKQFCISLKGYKHPLLIRYGTSDIHVLHQIFVEQEYSCLTDVVSPKLIIDCGANVGYSSAYFLNKYPEAHVIAVEPDSSNFEVCRKNLLPYGHRVSLIHAGVWFREVGLKLIKGHYRDCREWTVQVRECEPQDEPDIHAVDIGSLLSKSNFEYIDILKVDIERSELVVFSENYEDWLSRVKNIVIELHDEECEKVFFKAVDRYKYDLSSCGELTVCKGMKCL
ncbi:FkbM family methyltransferase [Trichocoleus sp. ST-U3]